MRYDRLLEGKYAVVTAGAHGLGFTTALLFAQHGATVAVSGYSDHGNESVKKLQEYAPNSFFFKGNMADEKDVNRFAGSALDCFGRVDILVNAVGINHGQQVHNMSMEYFDEVQRTNFYSALYMMRALLPGMYERHEGSIVNISSVNGLRPLPRMGGYAASKGAIQGISRVIANEAGPNGVRINTIIPGWVATTNVFDTLECIDDDEQPQLDFLRRLEDWEPNMTPARAADIASCALFLASEMSSFVTGHILDCSGGMYTQAEFTDYPAPEDLCELQDDFYRSMIHDDNLGRAPRRYKAHELEWFAKNNGNPYL